MAIPKYLDRLVDPLLQQTLAGLPVVLIVGPRACGKTTTASRRARSIVRLDRDAEAVAFRADPDSALARLPEPVLLDEWQMTPGVLGAIKRAVDTNPAPNRFLITGSVRADLEAQGWPLTGRAVRVAMYGLSGRELYGDVNAESVLDRIAAHGVEALTVPDRPPDLGGYVERALRGGFPEAALAASDALAQQWLDSYIEQVVTRDAELVDAGRDPQKLRRYLETLCLHTAGVVEGKALYDAAGINRKTAVAYDRLLGNLLIVEETPAWWTNRLKRLVRSPKRHVVDPAIAATVLRLDAAGVLRDGDVLGRLLDTYVMAQLRAELPVCRSRPRLHHLRMEQGRHEVDVIVELGGGRVIACEVKASSAPHSSDAVHLRWLRDQLGDRFVGGVVFHTGPQLYRMDDRIVAAPICALWGRA